VPDDALEGDGGAGVERAQAVGLRHRAHVRAHARVHLKRERGRISARPTAGVQEAADGGRL
jgi:hypothetical protein